ncbi:MAG: ParA family protein [Lachnospiraceae bacterium]|nr:ParA family protein [Lachnospiraceae bacterium]
MGKIIAVVNQKGGVGKTTTTMNLGYALAETGKKVLLIDFDPQSSLTVCMGYDDTDSLECTIATLMYRVMEDMELPEDYHYIYHHTADCGVGLDFIPCSMELSAVDVSLVNAVCRETVLKGILEELKADYDYIIIDCSPSLGMLTINALSAAQAVIIPLTPEYLSAKGLEILLKNILRVKRKINPELQIEGILFTMFKERMRLTQTVEEIVCSTYGQAVPIYNTKIPHSVKVGESTLQSQSIIQYARMNKVSQAYQQLAKEVTQHE